MENKDILLDQIKEIQSKVNNLRKDGVSKIYNENNEIRLIKNNKKLDKETKAKLISAHKSNIEDAKSVKTENSSEIKSLVAEGVKLVNQRYNPLIKEAKSEGKIKIANLKSSHKEELLKYKEEYTKLVESIKAEQLPQSELKNKLNNAKLGYKNNVFEANSSLKSEIQKIKESNHKLFLEKYNIIKDLKNDKLNIIDKTNIKFENYIFKFTFKDFFMKNGLYIIIVLFMLYCIIQNPDLISANNTMIILKNFSYKVFFALGVAGLILLGGTDLSVGRMVTLGSIFTCTLLNPNSPTKFFGISVSGIYEAIGFVPTLILALVVSILFCTIFSIIAGFFTAKFKIHPFITTLGTSLVIWGLVDYSTNNVKTGPITESASNLAKFIFAKGDFDGIPLILLYAIIAIVIVWFIWNKTKFGKNMYAVGGNQEAASVSGISVFKVTLMVFIMAGILYGVGSFVVGVQVGSSTSVLGQGWELEAIAACVVGGISFSGGIGKISGAVVGCLLFEVLKYYLRDITNGSLGITNAFIGIIILIAVIFDSIKYLKKK